LILGDISEIVDLLLGDHLALASVQGLGSLSQRPLGIFKKVLAISRDLVCFNRTMFRKNLMKGGRDEK
jgi:hypothetical protein